MSRIISASLITTMLNEAGSIGAFLDSVAAQSAVPAEVVIVDGGSQDGTADIARAWAPPEGCSVNVLVVPGAGISEGRNKAIDVARHERILVTDAGTELDPHWVETIHDGFNASTDVGVVSGFFHPTGETLIQRAIAFTITPRLGEIDPNTFLPSSRSVAFTKSAWAAAGGYPEWLDYCEDLIFDLALREVGARFVFRPDADVSWSARATIRSFMKQYYRYARGDGKAGLFRRRHIARYTAYAAGVALALASVRRPWAAALIAVGAVGYLRRFWMRIAARRRSFGHGSAMALVLVPMIVIAGDLAKMAGYPVGVRWRRRSQASNGASAAEGGTDGVS